MLICTYIMSKRWIYSSKAKEGSSLKKLAAGSLTFVKAYSNGQANSAIDSLEQELEEEIARERMHVPDTYTARVRHKGGKLMRSKQVLLIIVVLNIIDCALVLGELVLDLHHVKDVLSTTQQSTTTFLRQLNRKYPDDVQIGGLGQLEEIYQKITRAHIIWTDNKPYSYSNLNHSACLTHLYHLCNMKNDSEFTNEDFDLNMNVTNGKSRARRASEDETQTNDQMAQSAIEAAIFLPDKYSIEEKIAKGLHKISIVIVIILITETGFKVFCFGSHFLDNKLEVFDAFIVLTSFIVDLVFLSLSVYTIEEFVFILAFMLPWSVIRVVNSLVVAVRDHEHFRLKLLYTQKKRVDSENKSIRGERDKLRDQNDALRRLCLGEGIDEWKIQQSLSRQNMRGSKGIMGSFASLALGALSGGNKNTGATSIWNLLSTPRLKRGKSEEWEGKLGVNQKEDTRSLRLTDRLWTVSGTNDLKTHKARSLSHQNTADSDPGTPPTIRGKLKAFKRFLKRQETVSSFSSTETIDKHSKCSLDRMSTSGGTAPSENNSIEHQSGAEHTDESHYKTSHNIISETIEDRSEIDGDETKSTLSRAIGSEKEVANASPCVLTDGAINNCIIEFHVTQDTAETNCGLENPDSHCDNTAVIHNSNNVDKENEPNGQNFRVMDKLKLPQLANTYFCNDFVNEEQPISFASKCNNNKILNGSVKNMHKNNIICPVQFSGAKIMESSSLRKTSLECGHQRKDKLSRRTKSLEQLVPLLSDDSGNFATYRASLASPSDSNVALLPTQT